MSAQPQVLLSIPSHEMILTEKKEKNTKCKHTNRQALLGWTFCSEIFLSSAIDATDALLKLITDFFIININTNL